ncbi:hypothetical protein G7Y89_g9587 [Cudoniella acicularis]|uniref:N-acetyltransferase domain-containing protein n=1 Tax=Cudoniella acicularis TaxID=354080 RepID=A0A8H4RH12_9HELO|nr:hypothetical protein G7Y89_g9587 [Cudoniella acicularis]
MNGSFVPSFAAGANFQQANLNKPLQFSSTTGVAVQNLLQNYLENLVDYLAPIDLTTLPQPQNLLNRYLVSNAEANKYLFLKPYYSVSTPRILLVPYERNHVHTYNNWMQDEEIQIATASEPLSLAEEYEMQHKWRTDHDKLTFIACLPLIPDYSKENVQGGVADTPENMIGDVNLFLTPSEDNENVCVGELELMIALSSKRRQGFGRATTVAFLHYIEMNIDGILSEFWRGLRPDSTTEREQKNLQLQVKIGEKNEQSIKLFESLGFEKAQEKPNYFGEYQLWLPDHLTRITTEATTAKFAIDDYREFRYENDEKATTNIEGGGQ